MEFSFFSSELEEKEEEIELKSLEEEIEFSSSFEKKESLKEEEF